MLARHGLGLSSRAKEPVGRVKEHLQGRDRPNTDVSGNEKKD
jgi:hypothetical protein